MRTPQLADNLRRAVLQAAIEGKLNDRTNENARDLLAAIQTEKTAQQKTGKQKKNKPLAAIKEEEIPFAIPENWVWVRLGEVLELINGRAYKQNELLAEGKYKVLRVGNFFSNGSWYFSDLELPSERVHSLRSRTPKKAKTTICRLVLNLRSQFFQSRLFFSNQEKLRSTTHRFGNTAKRCNSFRLAISTSAPINSCTDEANALPV